MCQDNLLDFLPGAMFALKEEVIRLGFSDESLRKNWNHPKCKELEERIRQQKEQQLWVVQENIRKLDDEYGVLTYDERTPGRTRQFARDCLSELDTLFPAFRGRAVWDLLKALALLDQGKRSAIFSLPSDDIHRPRNDISRLHHQAGAAAVLEHARRTESVSVPDYADELSKNLYDAGFRRPGKDGRYSSAAFVKWRQQCKSGNHHSADFYELELALFSSADMTADDATEHLLSRCRIQYGSAAKRGKIGV